MNPSLLTILYWILLILSILGVIAPSDKWPYAWRISGIVWLALFVIIGLKLFKTSIQ